MVETLELGKLYERVQPFLLVTDTLVHTMDCLIIDHIKGTHNNSLPALLSCNVNPQLRGGGYSYCKHNDDILVVTPAEQAVYVRACQCSVQLYDEDDEQANWLDGPTDVLRLKFHDVPILGTFTSCFWTYAQIGDNMPVLDPAMTRTAFDQVPSQPPDAALALMVE